MNIVLQFYPNGEFSQGVDTSSNRPPKRVCKQMQTSPSGRTYTIADIQKVAKQNAEIPASVYGKPGVLFSTPGGTIYTYVEGDNTKAILRQVRRDETEETVCCNTSIYRLVHLGMLSPLVHQSVESCEIPKSRKKLLSMTKRMSRNIRNAVYLLEQRPGGKDVMSFLTLTLPNLSTEALKSCCLNWDSMVKRFLDWLRLKLRGAGIPLEHVYCTEIQTKRLTNRGEYAPHIHIIYRGRKARKHPWAVAPKQARGEWARCISAYVDEKFDTSALENLQRIKYSAARYLSKYLSKGCQSIPECDEGQPVFRLKTQWGGMARTLSQSIRKNTSRFTSKGADGHIAFSILDNMDKLVLSGCVRYFRRGFIPLGVDKSSGLEYGLYVGCGCLRIPTYEAGLIPVMDCISAINADIDYYDM